VTTGTNPAARAELHFAVEQFLFAEGRLLDERRFEEWEALFAADGYYWVPASHDQETPYSGLSLFYDDREMMRTRIRRLGHANIHVQKPPTRTCHIYANISASVVPNAPDEVLAESRLLVLAYRHDEPQQTYGGRCRHRLRRVAGGFEIAWKRVDLINSDGIFTALAIPF
jgi:ethylbenzene dioxygenase beta subunit